MNPRKLAVLAAAVGVLAAAVAVQKNLPKKPAGETQAPVVRGVTPALDGAFIQEIVVTQPDAKDVRLVKEGDAWKVASRYGIPARKESVDALVKDFSDLQGEVRANGSELLKDFGLDDSRAVAVEFKAAGGPPAKVLLSLVRPAGSVSFVRKPGSDEIVAVPKDLLAGLGLWNQESKISYKTLADMRVFPFDIPRVERIEILTGTKAVLVRSRPSGPSANASDPWTLEGGAAADAGKVNRFLVDASNVYGGEALDPSAPNGLPDKPQFALVVKDGGTERRIEAFLGPPDTAKKSAVVRSAPDGHVFSTHEESVAPLRKEKKDFE